MRKEGNLTYNEKIIHSLSLTLFSDSIIESSNALTSLYNWSHSSDSNNSRKAFPILIQSLARYIKLNITEWEKGPSIESALTALLIILQLLYSNSKTLNIENCSIVAGSSEIVHLLQRISFLPNSVLSRYSQQILTLIGRFCDISKLFSNPNDFIRRICSLFLISDPSSDETQIFIFFNFALYPNNLILFIEELSLLTIINRISCLLSYPSLSLRDFLLEMIYSLLMTNTEFKDSVCRNQNFLRILLNLSIPPFEPYDSKISFPLVPCQKSCVILIELSEDSRVSLFLNHFSIKLAKACIKWKSYWLSELAIKASNNSSQ